MAPAQCHLPTVPSAVIRTTTSLDVSTLLVLQTSTMREECARDVTRTVAAVSVEVMMSARRVREVKCSMLEDV